MDITKYNGQLIKPSKRPKCRENWYKDFDEENFMQKKMINYVELNIKR